MEAAEEIVEREEALANREFDPGFRAAVLKKLASKSLDELATIRDRIGGGWEPAVPESLENSLGSNVGEFLGSSVGDFVYNPVTPCRIIDTRLAGGTLAGGSSRNFRVTGANFSTQGGTTGSCGVPFGPATAVVINFVAVGGTANGNLAATPYPNAFPTSSIINWTPGVNIANGLTLPICNPATTSCAFDLSIQANSANPIHVVADVLGYFAAPFATSLDVQVVFSSYFTCASGFDCGVSQPCNTGYTITGGGCQLQTYSPYWYWANNSPAGVTNGWNCQGTNASTFARNMRTWAMCSRVPGR